MPTTRRAAIGNLPVELTSFVGRRRELAEVKRLLSESRLVTLTGTGGTGKTRLALRAATQLRRAFADGAWFVDFTELHEPGLLAQNVQDPDVLAFGMAATLGLREEGEGSPLHVLCRQIADRQMLLVLDNCEHLIPACAVLADTVLHNCRDLRILATSREPLDVPGEVLLPVPSLPVPDPHQPVVLADLSRHESVALFLARAASVVPGFGLNESNQSAVAELCRRLDGLPLAIELAAARVRLLAPEQMVERLADRFTLLSRGSRIAPERQQTLRACVDWSFDLCAKPERVLWARLSVFAGGFELDAVEAVCADERLPEADLLDLVAGLVDKSILVRDEVRDGQGEHVRFRMLETIRHYGQEKLREAGDDALLRRRHRDWYEQLSARACAEGAGEKHGYWLARLRRERANLRAAVDFCLTEPGEAEAALRLMVFLPRHYWRGGGLLGEGRRWLDRALTRVRASTSLRARALLVNSQLAFWQGDAGPARRLLQEGEELARRLGADAELAHAAYLRGLGAMHANDLSVAVETLSRARATLSAVPAAADDLDLPLRVLLTLGPAAALAGDYELAAACYQEMLAIVAPRGNGFYRSQVLWVGGLIDCLRGDLDRAAATVTESLRMKQLLGSDDLYGTALCLEALAWIAADQGHHRRAATLLGAADGRWTDIGASISEYRHLVGHHIACERRAREALGDATFTDALRHGRTTSYEDAIAYALDESRPAAPRRAGPQPTPLTRREQQIADLVAQGLSNKAIAATLVISQRTAETHVEKILTKLGFTNRAQVARWVTEHAAADQSF